jgi:hypothetical protein
MVHRRSNVTISLGAKWGLVVNVTFWPLYSGKDLWYPFKWRLGGPQSPKGFGDAFIVFDVEII